MASLVLTTCLLTLHDLLLTHTVVSLVLTTCLLAPYDLLPTRTVASLVPGEERDGELLSTDSLLLILHVPGEEGDGELQPAREAQHVYLVECEAHQQLQDVPPRVREVGDLVVMFHVAYLR